MKSFTNGVRFFTRSTVEISFPEDDVCCHHCPLMGVEMASSRTYCRRTGELLTATKDLIGFNCPLKFEKEEENCSEI